MEFSIAKLFLDFRETVIHQISEVTSMIYSHDHQLRALQSELRHLKLLIENKNENKHEDNEDIPF